MNAPNQERPACYQRAFAEGATWAKDRAAKLIRRRAKYIYDAHAQTRQNAAAIGELRAAATAIEQLEE